MVLEDHKKVSLEPSLLLPKQPQLCLHRRGAPYPQSSSCPFFVSYISVSKQLCSCQPFLWSCISFSNLGKHSFLQLALAGCSKLGKMGLSVTAGRYLCEGNGISSLVEFGVLTQVGHVSL